MLKNIILIAINEKFVQLRDKQAGRANTVEWLINKAHYQGARRFENKELTNVNDCFQTKCNAENGL